MIGQYIAHKYRVLRSLGEGTYGEVLLVEHTDLKVKFAIKLLKRTLTDQSVLVERFKREAEILLRFTHPGSTALRDFGRTDGGRYYMVTDFCEGVLLEDVITRKVPVGIPRTLKIMSQLCRTLDAAHKANIIHRDIKSSNVMIEGLSSEFSELPEPDSLVVKVLDFGIAKLQEELQSNQSSTQEGVSIGTPVYMSPEQAAGEGGLDHRVDLYAAGVLMYELLSGDVPFLGETVIQTLLRHLTQPPPPFPPELMIPLEVERITMRALEKERELRYQNGMEFAEDCEQAYRALSNPEAYQASLEAPVDSLAVTEQALAPSSSPEHKKPLVLCLDDNEMILEIMRHLLEREGYEVLTASSFASIHAPIFERGVALMLCDVQMPGLPGNKICAMLKQAKRDLKVALFSNLPDRELEALARSANADAWISKNAKPEQWLKDIRALTAGSTAE